MAGAARRAGAGAALALFIAAACFIARLAPHGWPPRPGAGRRLGPGRPGAAVRADRLPLEPVGQRLGNPRPGRRRVHPARRMDRRAWPDPGDAAARRRAGPRLALAHRRRGAVRRLGRARRVAPASRPSRRRHSTVVLVQGNVAQGQKFDQAPRGAHLPALPGPELAGPHAAGPAVAVWPETVVPRPARPRRTRAAGDRAGDRRRARPDRQRAVRSASSARATACSRCSTAA